jgi:uncharacterized protein
MTIDANDPEVTPAMEPLAVPATVMSEPLAPTTLAERVEAIDILRGLALFGILGANIRAFSGPPLVYFTPHLFWPGFSDRLAQSFVDAFIQGKFITIFAFLFGVGFTVQLTRAQERGAKFGSVYTRRLIAMIGIGLVHGLCIWFGDILVPYALIGFALFFFAKRKDKTILTWAVIAYLVPVAMMTLMFIGSRASGKPMKMPVPTSAQIQKEASIYAHGSFAEVQPQRVKDALTHNYNYTPFFGWQLLGLFLFGMLAWRKRFFFPTAENLPKYRQWMVIGLTLGSIINIAIVATRWIFNVPMMPPTPLGSVLMIIGTVGTPLLSLGYACAVIVLVQDAGWRARLQRFGAIGRTALSNYLFQSIVGTLLFFGYGVGLAGIGPAMLFIPLILIYAFQAWVSPIWLRHFRFGPAEWLWRTLTYGKLQPMVRRPEPLPPAEAAA